MLKRKNKKNKWSVTVTADGRRIRQTAHEKEIWLEKTRNKLLDSRSLFERKLYDCLPYALRKLAIPQFLVEYLVEYQSHVYFTDIFIKKYNIALEVDGNFHYSQEQEQRDKIREAHFSCKGIKTFRISNNGVADKDSLSAFINEIMELTLLK